MRGFLAAILLLACGCGGAQREAEIACYERLLTIAPGSPAISLEGCSERQRSQQAGLLRDADAIAAAIGTLRGPSEAGPPADLPAQERVAQSLKALHEEERSPALRSNPTFLELMDRIERFERRRAVIREDLTRIRERR